MAELNFGLLTPPGSQSIGNAFVQGMDQAAVARAQENQNALSQYTLGKAKREDELTTKMLAGLQGATTIEQQAAVLRSVGKVREASELMASDLERQYKLGQIKAQPGIQKKTELDNQEAKAKFFLSRLPTLSQNPDDAAIGRYLREAVDAGVMSFEEASAKSADLLSKSLPERRLQMLQGGQSAKDALVALVPKPTPVNVGNKIVFLDMNPNSPTFQREVMPQQNIGVSPNTQATLAQAQQHFNGLSAYQKEQLRRQGKQFDSDRGGIVDLNTGTFEPVYLYPSLTPAAPAAPAATPTAPSAAPAGTSPLQLTPGMAPPSASRVPIPQDIVGARVPQAVQNVMNNDQLKILLKERDNQVFLGRVDPNLDREIANLQGRPTSVASQTATQPAQRTVLGPKPEKATESYFKELKGVINTNDAINNLKQMVSTFTPADMLNPARRAEIDTAHKTAVLLAKEMFNLGVLNGGDQKILEQVIPDPIAFSKGLVPIETIRKNLDAASNVASRMNATLSKVHKQPLVQLDTIKPNEPNTPPPPIQSFRRQ